MKKFSVKTIVAIGIGAALFFVLGSYVKIPSPVPNTDICLQYGPVAGALVGFIGHTLIDFAAGWGIWWSWVIASAAFGLLMGFATKALKLNEGEVGKKGLIKFNIAQVIGHAISWIVIANVLDILMYSEPLNKIFTQSLMATASNSITTAIVGSLLCVAYAATKPKAGSLTKEEE